MVAAHVTPPLVASKPTNNAILRPLLAPATPPPLSKMSSPRWLGPFALLLAEYLLVTLHFDALPLLHSGGLSGSFGHLGIAAPLFLAVATVGYVLAGERFK